MQNDYNNGDQFVFEIIEVTENDPEWKMRIKEDYYARKYDSFENGYNCAPPFCYDIALLFSLWLKDREIVKYLPAEVNKKLESYKSWNTFKVSELEKVADALDADLKIVFIDRQTGEPII